MVAGISTAPGPYCELHAHSCFSLLDGVPFPEELAERALELGLPALALTDHDALYGLVPFCLRAKELGLKPIVGAEVTLEDRTHLTLLAENQAGYANLCQLITIARMNAEKGSSALPWEALPVHSAGLICLTGCRQGAIPQLLFARDHVRAQTTLNFLLDAFGRDQVYIELQRNLRRDDVRLSRWLSNLAQARGLKSVATGNVHYLTPADAEVQDVLVSNRERASLPELAESVRAWHAVPRLATPLRPNAEYFLRSAAEMYALYPDLPQAVVNTLEIAGRCSVELPMGLQVLPEYPTPKGIEAQTFLRRLCQRELPRLYPAQVRARQAAPLLEKELALIEQLGLANYFLVVWDIVNFCRRKGILCHGRGSAANSLAARLLGISAVDPIRQGLVVERFLSVEHGGTPDIDLDIDAARREQVIQYVYQRWGRDHAAMACTYVTYRSASAVRDAGFALGFSEETLAEMGARLETQRREIELDEDGQVEHVEAPVTELADQIVRAQRAAPQQHAAPQPEWDRLIALAERLRRRPRHLGLHNGGMVVTGAPIAQLLPVEPAAMDDRTVVQFDKQNLERLGIVKIDLLGLRMLSAIADALELAWQGRRQRIDLNRLDFRDKAVYDQICSARTIGMFQVESGAQVSIIPHLQPRTFQDLVVEVSLIRPGPLQGNMVRPYIRRRQGLEPVTYAHPSLAPALADTLGVIVFQEQVIKIARDFAGFTPGRGEVLRRALGSKHASEELDGFRTEFITGALARGVIPPLAEQVWALLAGFAGYSFSKAHAAAFAVIVFWSGWLRVHYPVEYFCGLLRHAPLGTYPANVLESEARRCQIKFLPIEVNRSLALPTVDASRNAIRHGLSYVKGIGDELAEYIVQARGKKPYRSLADFIRRTGAERRPAEALALAGAFDAFGERRQVLWDLAEAFDVARRPRRLALDSPAEHAAMRPMPDGQKLMTTFAMTGVTGGMHLVEVRRDEFTQAGCIPYRRLLKLRSGARVRVGGLVADGLRRPPTAKGTSFIRLEDPDGIVDVVVPAPLFAAAHAALRSAFIVVEGRLQKKPGVLTVTAERVRAL